MLARQASPRRLTITRLAPFERKLTFRQSWPDRAAPPDPMETMARRHVDPWSRHDRRIIPSRRGSCPMARMSAP